MVNLEKIAKCLKELGYEKLTEIQKRSLQEVYTENRSAIIVAPTGSGKTEAAVFPVMLKIAASKLEPIAAIYVTPLRALNRDIASRLERIGRCFGLEVAVRHGDTPQRARKLITKSPPHVLVTTPETFNYIVLNDDLRKKLANLEFIVLDEFRELLESKRGLLLLTNIYLLEKYLNKRLTKIALTATLSKEIEELAKRLLEPAGSGTVVLRDTAVREMDVKVIIPECSSSFCKSLSAELGDSRLAARVEAVCGAVSEHKHVLVFTNTRALAERLGALLNNVSEKYKLGLRFEVHHGSLSRQHRERVERGFKKGEINSLIATSSLELGIDIGHVNYVIQYMSPRQVTRLVQRIGRSRHRIGEASSGAVFSTENIFHALECAVIVAKAREGFNERELVHENPLDVLAYTVALYTAINSGGVGIDQLYDLLVQYPLYSTLAKEDLLSVIDYLAYTRVIKVQNNTLYPTGKTRLYLFRVSMIPSSREVIAVSVDRGESVGALDEEYVVVYVNPGDLIVLAGKLWRIVGYDSEAGKLYVEPAKADVEQVLVPHWEGENIPVEYAVASEVGVALRYTKDYGRLPDHLRTLLSSLVTPDYVKELGDDTSIYVDYVQQQYLVIINVFGGTRLNSLLRDLVKYVVKSMYPQFKVKVHSTPYSLIIKFFDPIPVEAVKGAVYEVLRELYRYAHEEVINRVVQESTSLLWRIYQVAQRFGAITAETRVSRKLLEVFRDTIIGKEAVKEVLQRDYDLSSFLKLCNAIRAGLVKVHFRVYDRPKQHHIALLEYAEIPQVLGNVVFDTSGYYERLLRRRINLFCINCGYRLEGRVGELLTLNTYSCPKCGYATLAVVKGDVERVAEIVRKFRRGEKLTPEERKLREDLAKRAILLYRYRERALLALAGRGVGTQEAIRIINRSLEGADLISEVAECEKRFLMVKDYIKEREEDGE